MTVAQFSGDISDFAVGLIATSKHQSGAWNMRHQPKMDWIMDPSASGGAAQQQVTQYLQNQIGFDSNRWQRGSEQFTEHTALFVRLKGTAAWSKGWVPRPGVGTYFQALVMGGECVGMWRDDLDMINDPTCISVEFPVRRWHCSMLIEYFDSVKDRSPTTLSASGSKATATASGRPSRYYGILRLQEGLALRNGLPRSRTRYRGA